MKSRIQAWWHKPFIPAFGRLRQRDLCELEGRMVYTARTQGFKHAPKARDYWMTFHQFICRVRHGVCVLWCTCDQRTVLSFQHVASGDGTQVFRFGGKYLHLVNCFASHNPSVLKREQSRGNFWVCWTSFYRPCWPQTREISLPLPPIPRNLEFLITLWVLSLRFRVLWMFGKCLPTKLTPSTCTRVCSARSQYCSSKPQAEFIGTSLGFLIWDSVALHCSVLLVKVGWRKKA